MTTVACSEPAALTPGSKTVTSVIGCDIKYFNPQRGAFSAYVIVEIVNLTGSTNAYVSTIDKNPGPFSYDVSALGSTNATKIFRIARSVSEITPLYIGVEGVASDSSFSLDVWSGKRYGFPLYVSSS